MQFARKRKQKHCVLFDAHSDHSKSVNHYKNERKTEKMQQYLIYLTCHRGAGSTHKPSEPTKTASFWDTSWKKNRLRETDQECRSTWIWNDCHWARLHAWRNDSQDPYNAWRRREKMETQINSQTIKKKRPVRLKKGGKKQPTGKSDH